MFRVVVSMDLPVLVDIDVMLKLLERVLRSMCERVQAGMHVTRGKVTREHAAGRQRIVGRESVKRVGKHGGGLGDRILCSGRYNKSADGVFS